jgi:hypothetical protein
MKKDKKFFNHLGLIGWLFLFSFSSTSSIAQGVKIIGPQDNCEGTSVVLKVEITGLQPPYTYLWSTGHTTATININATMWVQVTVTGLNSLGQPQSVSSPWTLFTFHPVPNATITASGPTNLCSGQSVTLTASGGNATSTYTWNTGQTGTSITVNTSGTYTVTVQNPGGCSSQASQKVTVYGPNNPPTITASGPTTFCFPGSVTLTAEPGLAPYLWSTGATSQSITVTRYGSGPGVPQLDTITVSYLATINPTCVLQSNSVLVRSIRKPRLVDAYCPNYNLTLGDSIKTQIVLPIFGVPAAYDFNFEETTQPGVTWTVHSPSRWLRLANVNPPLQVGKFYNVRVRGVVNGVPYCYGNPCTIGIIGQNASGGNLRVLIDEDGEQIIVREPLNFAIYPNPSYDVFYASIFTHDRTPITARIYDMTGRLISSETFDADLPEYVFGHNLKVGIFFVEFIQGELRQTSRVIRME